MSMKVFVLCALPYKPTELDILGARGMLESSLAGENAS